MLQEPERTAQCDLNANLELNTAAGSKIVIAKRHFGG
jgi:hypothetical protein